MTYCRHVMLPKDVLKVIPKDYFDSETGSLRILHEEEWRSLGITQVPSYSQNMADYCRASDGYIMKFMVSFKKWIDLTFSSGTSHSFVQVVLMPSLC
jgi:Cyclin-dependent kinase regulatory subunit